MKRTALVLAGLLAVPVAGAALAGAQTSPDVSEHGGVASGSTATPNTDRRVVLQAGSTRPVPLRPLSAGTGYAWKWVTKPSTSVVKVGAPRAAKGTPGAAPGSKVIWRVGVLGLAEDMKTTGTVGLYGPGATTPERTITLKITVTGDGR